MQSILPTPVVQIRTAPIVVPDAEKTIIIVQSQQGLRKLEEQGFRIRGGSP